MRKSRIDLPFCLLILFLTMILGYNLNPDSPGNKKRRREKEEKERLVRLCREIQQRDYSKGTEPVDSDYLIKYENSEKLIVKSDKTMEQNVVKLKSDSSPKMHQKSKKSNHRHSERVDITVYNPDPKQTDADFLTTADLSKIDLKKLRNGSLRWVAVSQDLLGKFNYGDVIFIDSCDPEIRGHYEVHDTMNPRWTNKIDILHASRKTGKWTDVRVIKV